MYPIKNLFMLISNNPSRVKPLIQTMCFVVLRHLRPVSELFTKSFGSKRFISFTISSKDTVNKNISVFRNTVYIFFLLIIIRK